MGRLLRIQQCFGEKTPQLLSKNPKTQVEIMAMDEMHSHIGSKKVCWIWIAVDRNKKPFISCVLGMV